MFAVIIPVGTGKVYDDFSCIFDGTIYFLQLCHTRFKLKAKFFNKYLGCYCF
jgi:hypothetical protein